MNPSPVPLRCLYSSYNSGVSFLRTWTPFLWNVIIRKDRHCPAQSLWEGRILTSSLPANRHSWSNDAWTVHFPDSAQAPTVFSGLPLFKTSCHLYKFKFNSCWTHFPIAVVCDWLKSVLTTSVSRFVYLEQFTQTLLPLVKPPVSCNPGQLFFLRDAFPDPQMSSVLPFHVSGTPRNNIPW